MVGACNLKGKQGMVYIASIPIIKPDIYTHQNSEGHSPKREYNPYFRWVQASRVFGGLGFRILGSLVGDQGLRLFSGLGALRFLSLGWGV